MASRTWRDDKTIGVAIRRIYIRFFPNATSDPTFVDPGGTVASIVYASGTYTITLKDVFVRLIGAHATYQAAAANIDMYAQMGDCDVAAKTYVVQMKTAGTNTQPAAADANQSVSVELVFQESVVTT
jgi:hypothetical protein